MVMELRSFLGFMNYYLHFKKWYAKVIHHLYDQISGDNTAQKKKQIQWTEECQNTFHAVEVMCTSAPVLAFANLIKPFKLHMDHSTVGLGAILYQEQGRKDWVIGYTS